jgi:hypothetical protein
VWTEGQTLRNNEISKFSNPSHKLDCERARKYEKERKKKEREKGKRKRKEKKEREKKENTPLVPNTIPNLGA